MQGSVPDARDVGSCDSCRMTQEGRGLFARSQSDRVILGVAGGIGEKLGVDPVLVRFALGAVTIASGLGIVLYLAAWSFSYEPAAGTVAAPPARMSGWRPVVAMGCIVLGSLLVLRDIGLWTGDTFVWPILIAGAGSTIIWFRSDAAGRARWTAAGGRMVADPAGVFTSASSRLRPVAGGLFVLFGMTVFLFSHQAAGAPETALPPPESAAAPHPQSASILLVEDHPDSAEALAALLESLGYRVQVAGSIAAAVAVDLAAVDLLLSDLGLPDGTGLDLLRQLHTAHPSLRAIALSGYGMESDRERSREAGFRAHLVKPTSIDTLQSVIRRVLAEG